MLVSDVRNERMCRLCNRAKIRQFARMIRSKLQHGYLIPLRQTENHLRNADVIIQITLCAKHRIFFSEHRNDHLFRRGLSVAAADGKHGKRKFLSIYPGQFTQCFRRIRNAEKRYHYIAHHGCILKEPRFIHDNTGSPAGKNLRNKLMPVKRFTAQCKEQVTGGTRT